MNGCYPLMMQTIQQNNKYITLTFTSSLIYLRHLSVELMLKNQ